MENKAIMTHAAASTGNKEPVVSAILLAILTAVLLLPSIRGVDGTSNYVYLMSILMDGDLDFSNEYAAFDHARRDSFNLSDAPVHPATGLPANRYGVGSAIFWAPAVMVVHFVLLFGSPELATGMSPPYAWAVGLASAFWGCLGAWLIFMRVREQFGSYAAWLALAGMLFATPLAFYVWAHGSMSHAVSFFAAVMALLSLERAWRKGTALSALIAGVWAGLVVLVRLQDVTWTAAFGLGLLIFWPREIEGEAEKKPALVRAVWGRYAAALIFAVGVAVAMSLQMAVWRTLYGSWFSGPLPYLGREGGTLEFLPRHFFSVLVSERGGVFAWHPILLAGLAGVFAARRQLGKAIFWTSVIGIVLQFYLVSSWSMWWGGASFGNRFFISSYPVFALGLGWIILRLRERSRTWVAPVILLLLIGWNTGLLLQYGTEMISREDEVGWGVVLRNQFTEVPAWVFDRLPF